MMYKFIKPVFSIILIIILICAIVVVLLWNSNSLPNLKISNNSNNNAINVAKNIPSNVQISSAGLNFKQPSQNIAPVKTNASDNFTGSIANPAITAMNVGGKSYVFMLTRVKRITESGNRLVLARIPADKFSQGETITPQNSSAWYIYPDSQFNLKNPSGSTGVLNPAMTASNGKLLITYQARLTDTNLTGNKTMNTNNSGFISAFDPDANTILWTKNILDVSGYMGGSKPTGLTRVTAGKVSNTGDYFDSTKGRIVIGYECNSNNSLGCLNTSTKEKLAGFIIQELKLTGSDLSLSAPITLFKEEVPDNMTVNAWAAQGEKVWKKQSFTLHNAGSDTLLFSVNYNLVTENTPARPADRDWPGHASFFKLSGISTLLDNTSKTSGQDISSKMPASRTWTQDLTNDSPWDQGAIWNSMLYIDPFNQNKTILVYEAWGALYMQPAQTRDTLYGGSVRNIITAQNKNFSKSCDQFCSTNTIQGGGAHKPYCLSASGLTSNGATAELSHNTSFKDIKDGTNNQSLTKAVVVCSDLGTSEKLNNNFSILTKKIDNSDSGKSVNVVANNYCVNSGAKGYIWADLGNQKSVSSITNVSSGQTITTACSNDFTSADFRRNIITSNTDQSCSMSCGALGAGNGSGFRSYRSLINAPGTMLDNTSVDPLLSINLYQALNLNGRVWTDANNYHLDCTCGPGGEMGGVTAGKIAD